ncbi:hypothetical protein V8C40DRAFT_28990 [Trichoderma camerunense]
MVTQHLRDTALINAAQKSCLGGFVDQPQMLPNLRDLGIAGVWMDNMLSAALPIPNLPSVASSCVVGVKTQTMAFDLQTYRCQRSIGFRVESHGQNCTFDDEGNMVARNPWRTGDAQACSDHFRWGSRRKGPFISFFTSWRAALRRRQWMLNNGASEVFIVAVWLDGLLLVYDAWRIARDLNLGNLQWFGNEVLVHGGISADSYRILAIFHGNGNIKQATLRLNGLNATVEVPGEFIDGVSIKRNISRKLDATELLRDELYTRTGTRDDAKFIPLVLSMADFRYFRKVDDAGAMILFQVVLCG